MGTVRYEESAERGAFGVSALQESYQKTAPEWFLIGSGDSVIVK